MKNASKMKWAVIEGNFDFQDQKIIFKGEKITSKDSQGVEKPRSKYGQIMNNVRFTGGDIRATAEFTQFGDNSCEIIFYFDPAQKTFVSAGLGSAGYFIRHWDGPSGQGKIFAQATSKLGLLAEKKFDLNVNLRGSQVRLSVNEVDVLAATLPFSIPPSQTGISCVDGQHTITISNFTVEVTPGRAFVVMQFSSPFNEIFDEVIKNVCREFGIDAHRADEAYGPGLIIADVTKDITHSDFVIAEITPANPNVYYEIGYAHAMNKPTILLADSKVEKLPFDISGFRTLFYENSITGKRKFEEGLRNHISAILENKPIYPSQDQADLPRI